MGKKYVETVYNDIVLDEDGAYDGEFSIVRRAYDDGEEQIFMRFPNTKHEVWGVEELRVMRELLNEFFEKEGLTGEDEHGHDTS